MHSSESVSVFVLATLDFVFIFGKAIPPHTPYPHYNKKCHGAQRMMISGYFKLWCEVGMSIYLPWESVDSIGDLKRDLWIFQPRNQYSFRSGWASQHGNQYSKWRRAQLVYRLQYSGRAIPFTRSIIDVVLTTSSSRLLSSNLQIQTVFSSFRCMRSTGVTGRHDTLCRDAFVSRGSCVMICKRDIVHSWNSSSHSNKMVVVELTHRRAFLCDLDTSIYHCSRSSPPAMHVVPSIVWRVASEMCNSPVPLW